MLSFILQNADKSIIPKKIVLCGYGKRTDAFMYELSWRFEIVGIVGYSFDKVYKDSFGNIISVITKEELKNISHDAIFYTGNREDYKKVFNEINNTEEKIYNISEWRKYVKCPSVRSLGELNPDKTYYVISERNKGTSGLFALMMYVLLNLEYALRKNYIPVIDFKYSYNYLLEKNEVGIKNSWEYYFDPVSDVKLEDVFKSKNVIFSGKGLDYINIKRFKEIYHDKISIKKIIQEHIDKESSRVFGTIDKSRVLGVLCRGTDYTTLKPDSHFIQPNIEEIFEKVYEYYFKWNCEKIYIATEDEKVFNSFKEEFGEKLIYAEQLRFSNTGGNLLADIEAVRDNDRYLRGLEYLTVIYLLSECGYLIGGQCAGLQGAIILKKGTYNDQYIFDLGKYNNSKLD